VQPARQRQPQNLIGYGLSRPPGLAQQVRAAGPSRDAVTAIDPRPPRPANHRHRAGLQQQQLRPEDAGDVGTNLSSLPADRCATCCPGRRRRTCGSASRAERHYGTRLKESSPSSSMRHHHFVAL